MSPKDLVYYESVDNSESSPPESQQQSRFQVQPLKKIRFNEHARVHYLSADETESRTQHKSDIWYMRSDLMTMRKNDRQTLLLALRSVAARAQERVSTQLHPGVTSSMDGSSASPPISPSEFEAPAEFCFRGMEIILYKKEREESRRRAIQAVLSEQHSQRIKENNRKQKGLVILETPKLRSQQRISDEYRLATRKAYDEAYLRGLGDAQEARTIFQQSLLFPFASSRIRQTKIATTTESKNPESPRSNGSREAHCDEQRDAPAGEGTSLAGLSDILSAKLILQRSSQLKRIGNASDPVAFCWAPKYQSS
jgi:hypothetical protein